MRIHIGNFLKSLRFCTHPILLILIFLILPIVPRQLNGFYFNYIWEGLLHLKLYSLTAIGAIALLFYSLLRHKLNWKDQKTSVNYIGSWFNESALILIIWSLLSFYSMDNTPYFSESTSSFSSCFVFIYFFLTCHAFNAFNLTFLVFNALDKYMDKSEFYDDDEYYGGFDDYMEF